MTWIRVDSDMIVSPQVYAVARDLNVRRAHALGLIIGLWSLARKECPTGDVTDLQWERLRDFCGSQFRGERIKAALVAGGAVVDAGGRLVIPSWDRDQGGIVRIEERDRWRKYYHRLTPAIRAAVIQRDGLVCGICGEPIEGAYHIDHILPVSRGGSTTDLQNLRPAHPACNLRRGNRS